MANLVQLRMLEDLNGFLLVDKPAGLAFTTIVKTVKRKFNLVKVGHGGSLDAMASGLLVLLLNDANKFVGDVMGADRSWTGSMRLGRKTNTHDAYGTVVKDDSDSVVDKASPDAIARVLPEFKGDVFQTESRWCSVRREASASYDIADTGEHKPFLAHVYRFVPGELAGESLPFEIKGSKGLIVRTLVNDFGDALGCGACLECLRRIQVGKFSVSDAISFDKLLETDITDFASLVTPLSKALA